MDSWKLTITLLMIQVTARPIARVSQTQLSSHGRLKTISKQYKLGNVGIKLEMIVVLPSSKPSSFTVENSRQNCSSPVFAEWKAERDEITGEVDRQHQQLD